MLMRRISGALVFSVALSISAASADTRLGAPARALTAEFAANDQISPEAAPDDGKTPVAAPRAPGERPDPEALKNAAYPHIYQAPLFGTVFAINSQDATVDESALRYYASLHNVARANAEIRRLKALHPTWTPPTNIYAAAGAGTDEQPFWDLLAADRMEELHAGIALRMKGEPGWRPSRDLIGKIERREAIAKLVKASDQSRWNDVLEITDANPSILHCAYMDANWRVAEAFLQIGLSPRAFEIYHAIIASCADHDERVATIRKAITRFSVDQAKSLIAMGAKSNDGAMEFDAVKIDLTRARIGALNAGKSQDVIEPDALADFFAEATRSRAPSDIALAAWFEFDRGRFAEADKWFVLITPLEPPGKTPEDVKAAEGHALSLLKSGNVEGAVRVAWAWRATSDTLRSTYVGAMISLLTQPDASSTTFDALLRDFIGFVEANHDFLGGQALAWRYLNHGDLDGAVNTFKAALTWKNVDPLSANPAVSDPQVLKAIEGYATALTDVGRIEQGLEIADAWRNASPDLRKLFVSLAINAVNGADRADALGGEPLTHLAEAAREDRFEDGASALGWLLYRTGDYAAAIDWFELANSWSPSGKGDLKSNQGLALALKQSGRLAEAEELGWAWHKQSADMRAVYVASVVAQLSRDDLRGQVSGARLERFTEVVRVDRSALGAQALGWFRLSQGNCFYAAPWFRAATAWTAEHDADQKTAEGLGLSLMAVGQFNEAEDLAYAWRLRSDGMRAQYMKVGVEELTRDVPVSPMSEPRLERFAQVVLEERDALGAQAMGWRRYRQAGCGYGADWFRLATQWVDEDRRDAKTDEGYGLSLRLLGRLPEAEALARRWADSVPLMKKLYIDVVVEELSIDNPPEPIDESRLADFASQIEPVKSPLGAQALGWYRLERGELDEAAKWFKTALDEWPARHKDQLPRLSAPAEDYKPVLAQLALNHDAYRRTPRAFPNASWRLTKVVEPYVETPEGAAKTTEGYALTLRAMGRIDEAQAIALAWRDRWPPLRRLFDDIATAEISRSDGATISSDQMRLYIQAISQDRSSTGAEAMGWRLYGAKDFNGAIDWFRSAMDWSPSATSPRPLVVEGYVLALRSAKRFDEALALAERWRAISPRLNLVYLETSLMKSRASGEGLQLSARKYAEIEATMREAHSAEGALSMGWLAFEEKEYARALTWFHNAVDWSDPEKTDPKALEGLSLTLRSLGRYEELTKFARQWRDVSPQVRSNYYAGMIEWLTRSEPLAMIDLDTQADFEALVDDDRNPAGAQAIAWGRQLRMDYAGAEAWFANAIAWGGYDAGAPSGNAALDKTQAKTIEGYLLAIRGAGDLERAEEIAFAWRNGPPELRGLYSQIFTEELAKAENVEALSPERLARFAQTTQDERSPIGAGNLGWFAYRASDPRTSVAWFELAISWSGGKADAKVNEGYTLALRAAGRLTEAEEFAWLHRAQAKELRQAYVAAVSDQLFDQDLSVKVTPARLDRFAGIVRADKLAAGAQAMGWRRVQDGNCGYSVGWFRAALAWTTDHANDDKISSGLVQGLRSVGMFNEAEDVAYGFVDRSSELRELYLSIGVEELTREWPRVPMNEARISRFSSVVLSSRSDLGAQAIGWRRYSEAGCGYGGEWFHLAASWSKDGVGDAKLNEGWALTQRATGRLARAEALVYPWIERQPPMKKLYIDVVVEELSRDNPPEPLPESRITAFEQAIWPVKSPLGAQALAWYRFARGENDPAAKWFQNALSWWPRLKTEIGDQKLSTPVEDYDAVLAKLALRIEDYRRTPRAFPNSSLLIGKTLESYVDSPGGLAKTVEGYVLTLGALNRWEDAEKLAFEWRDRWPHMRDVFIGLVVSQLTSESAGSISPERLASFAALVDSERSGKGAEALGWKEFGAQHFDEATRWFRSAMNWAADGKNATPDLNLIQGYALALRGAKQFSEATRLLAEWREKLPALQPLYVEIGLDDLQSLDPASPDATRRLNEIATGVETAKSPSGASSLGWLAFQRKEFAAAQAWFKQAIVWTEPGAIPDTKALEGYSRSLQAQQRFTDFVTFTGEWAERAPSLKPIYIEAAAQAFAASAAGGEDLPMDLVVHAGKAFAEAHSANGAQALAWQRVSMKDWVDAAAWFQAARNWSNGAEDPKVVEGLILAQRNLHHDDEAEALAFAGAAHDDNMRELYIEIVADRLTRTPPTPPNEAGIRRFADLVTTAKSANGAQALGWYSYNAKQLTAAVAWFQASLSFEPSENAALGLAFTYRKQSDKAAYANVIATYGAQFAKVAQLAGGKVPRLEERRAVAETGDMVPAAAAMTPAARMFAAPRRSGAARPRAEPVERAERAPATSTAPATDNGSIVGALNAKQYGTCVARAEAAGSLNTGQQSAMGWCLLNLNRPQESARAFEVSLHTAKGKQRDEAAYGKSLALLAGGESTPAGASAAQSNLTAEQRDGVGVRILEQRAWGAWSAGRYAEVLQWLDRRAAFAPDRRDLMRLREHCLDKLGRPEEASAIRGNLEEQMTE